MHQSTRSAKKYLKYRHHALVTGSLDLKPCNHVHVVCYTRWSQPIKLKIDLFAPNSSQSCRDKMCFAASCDPDEWSCTSLRVVKDVLIGRATCFPKYSPLAIERRKKNVSMSMGELSSCVAILLFAKGVFVLITTSISFNSETDSIHTNQRYVKNFVCTGFL